MSKMNFDQFIDNESELFSVRENFMTMSDGTANNFYDLIRKESLDLNQNIANYNEVGDVIEPRGLGIKSVDVVSKSLQPNVSITYDVETFDLVDSSNFTYQLSLFDPHSFIVGDRALINDTCPFQNLGLEAIIIIGFSSLISINFIWFIILDTGILFLSNRLWSTPLYITLILY